MLDQSSFANKHFQRLVVLLDSGQPPPYRLKDKLRSKPTRFFNYKCLKFSILVLKFNDLLKITSKWSFACFEGRVEQHSPTQAKFRSSIFFSFSATRYS